MGTFHPSIRLPSDSTSRWTPLPSANSSYCQVCSGLSPPSNNACQAHQKNTVILTELRCFLWQRRWDSNPRPSGGHHDFESFSQLVKNWSFPLRRKPHKIRLFRPWGLIRLHFIKVGSNRHFCRFWREITREGNTKFNTP